MEAQDLVTDNILNATKFEDISDMKKIVRVEFAHFSAS